MSRAVGVQQPGAPDALEVIERPIPEPGTGELRLRVHAATVNPADVLIRLGDMDDYLKDVPRPHIPGMDAAGVVDAIGDGVDTDLRIGDAAMTFIMPLGPTGGAYAEHVVVPADGVARSPKGADHAHASTLPMNGLTARRALDVLALQPGDTLAVTGAAGALGGYVLALARADGLRTIAVAAADDAALVRELGADVVVERGDDVAARVRAQAPDGVHAVVDAALIGAPIQAAIRDGGGLALVRGFWQRGMTAFEPERGIVLHVINVGDYLGRRDLLDRLREQVEQGVLRLRVAARHPPEDAPQAHAALEAGGSRGRHVIEF